MNASTLPPDLFSDLKASFVLGESYGWKLTLTGTGFIFIEQSWGEHCEYISLHHAAVPQLSAELRRLAALSLGGKSDSAGSESCDPAVYLTESGYIALAQAQPGCDPMVVLFRPSEVPSIVKCLSGAHRAIKFRLHGAK